MKPIVVVGSINMDLVSQTHRMPMTGETVTGTSFQLHSGGKGANQAVAVARLGHASILLGATGDDIFGTQLRETLDDFGVATQGLLRTKGASGTANIVVDDKGDNVIVVVPGANAAVTPQYLEDRVDLIESAGMVLTQLEIPLEAIQWLADRCAERGVPLMLDPAPAASLPPSLLRKISWFTPNETEAAFYADGPSSMEETAAKFLDAGVKNVILKRGSEGVYLASSDGRSAWVDALRVDAVDTTAAGDAFNGAFAVGLQRGFPMEEAARFAVAAAAVSVTRKGAQHSLASNAEVLAMLEQSSDTATSKGLS